MRIAAAAVALMAVTLPGHAFAQDAGESDLTSAVETMSDPATQEQAALMAAMLVGALMEMPVAPLAEAVSTMAGEDSPAIDPDARVRDYVGPEAARAPEVVAERLPEMMEAMAGMAGAFEQMLPQLRELAERLPQNPQGEEPQTR
ncbi:MAG: hypothetical protein JY451_01810 [Erythrobacter sp.]|nr:MAG: hypothetical protein JY451_01810 [Erythrobacter sp.]